MNRLSAATKTYFDRVMGRLLGRYLAERDLSEKLSYATKISQKTLFLQYQEMMTRGCIPSVSDVGYRVFSEADEDGIFVFVFALIGTANKTFVDIGAADGINSNCANLAIHFGWHGLFLDANYDKIVRGEGFYGKQQDTRIYPPKFVHVLITRDNVNDCITRAGFSGEVDLLSIDIDGNDYWIWDAIRCVSPRVVCIETHVEFGLNDVVVPYDAHLMTKSNHPDYFGASLVAMMKLAKRKGYRLIGANKYGYNSIYIRNDIGQDILPEASLESVLRHPGNREWEKQFEAVRGMSYLEG